MSCNRFHHQASGVRLVEKAKSMKAAAAEILGGHADVAIWNGDPTIENCHKLARLLGGSRRSDMFATIRDIKVNAQKTQSIAESFAAHPLHTDGSFMATPPEYFFLQVVETDPAGGGVSLFLSVEEIVRQLPISWVHALVSASVGLGRFDENRGTTDAAVGQVIFHRPNGNWGFRWRSDEQVTPTVVDEKQTQITPALEWITNYLRRCPVASYNAKAGDHIVISNDRVLHGRTELSGNSNRWLRRVWIA